MKNSNIINSNRSSFNFKYKWSLRKYWIPWFKSDMKRWYYSKIHNFNMGGYNGTMVPVTGQGEFISVYTKGQIIQIKHESGYEHLEFDEVRIIPRKENHGVMVERFKNGKMRDRNLLHLAQFNKGIIFASNIEQLTDSWISVDDDLPAEGEEVLVYDPVFDTVGTGDRRMHPYSKKLEWYIKSGGYSRTDGKIRWWMPKPSKPNKSKI